MWLSVLEGRKHLMKRIYASRNDRSWFLEINKPLEILPRLYIIHISKKIMVKKAIIHRARYEFRNMLDQQFLPQAGIPNQGSRFQHQEIEREAEQNLPWESLSNLYTFWLRSYECSSWVAFQFAPKKPSKWSLRISYTSSGLMFRCISASKQAAKHLCENRSSLVDQSTSCKQSLMRSWITHRHNKINTALLVAEYLKGLTTRK